MPTETPLRPRVAPSPPRRFRDTPWRRLPTEALIAVVLLASALYTFSRVLSRPLPPPPPKTIDEKIVVLPTPAPPPKPKPKPKPMPKPKHLVHLRRAVKATRRPPPKPIKVVTNVATADKVVPTPAPQVAEAETPPPDAAIGAEDTLQGNVMGAKALFKPLPQIPDDLRHDALNVVAVARFHVAPDGSATVELEKATGNTELNELLLESFKKWRFFPALLDGKPIRSTIEIQIPIEVK